MGDLAEQQLEDLVKKFSPLIEDFKIPAHWLGVFNKFKLDYYNYNLFFDKIESIETEILPIFLQNIEQNLSVKEKSSLNSAEIDKFLSGDITVKTLFDKFEVKLLKDEIHNVFVSYNQPVNIKLLHLLAPSIVKIIYSSGYSMIDIAIKFLGHEDSDISFEVGFFNMRPGKNSVHWHDDYTLFCNRIPSELDLRRRLLLNFHIALTDVKNTSSPLCFLKGTENLVYGRSAIKYFKDNGIKFNEDLFLKAVFLTENLYKPGEEVKANFIGLLPAISYRLHQMKNANKDLRIFFNELDSGMVQIFSPHISHTSPLINKDSFARESLVLRFFASSDYNYRNVITIGDLISCLSFVKAREVKLDEVNEFFFKDNPNISLASQIYTNLYVNKNAHCNESTYLKVYIEDLHNFFLTE